MTVARRKDPDLGRAKRMADEHAELFLKNFRLALKNTGKSEDEIDRWCAELEERMQPRRP
jgi:hypothetical protein